MARGIFVGSMLAILAAFAGCSMCSHPFDYCGPTFRGGDCGDGCDPTARAGSILSHSVAIEATDVGQPVQPMVRGGSTEPSLAVGDVFENGRIISITDDAVGSQQPTPALQPTPASDLTVPVAPVPTSPSSAAPTKGAWMPARGTPGSAAR